MLKIVSRLECDSRTLYKTMAVCNLKTNIFGSDITVKEVLSMSVEWIDEARVRDKDGTWKLVRVGDTLEAKPAELRVRLRYNSSIEDAEKRITSIKECLKDRGDEGLVIKRIGAWPCGMCTVYFDSGCEYRLNDFM